MFEYNFPITNFQNLTNLNTFVQNLVKYIIIWKDLILYNYNIKLSLVTSFAVSLILAKYSLKFLR